MKKIILILFLFPSILLSQWVQQQLPADIGILLSIDFVNNSTGVSTGWILHNDAVGRAVYTTNGGINWLTAQLPDSSRSLVTVQMINSATGYCAATYNITGAQSRFAPQNKFYYSKFRPIGYNTFTGRDTTTGTRGFLLKTTNSGHNWFPYGAMPEVYYLIGMHFINASTGFVSAQQTPTYPWTEALYKTTNGGLNWTLSYAEQYTESIRNIFFVNSSTAIAVGYVRINNPIYPIEGMIIRTTNGGLNWSRQIFYYVNNFTDITMVNGSTGFASGVSNSDTIFRGIIYKTTNAGQNWFKLNFQLDTAIFDGVEFYPGSGAGFCNGTEEKGDTSFPGSYSVEHTVISKTTDYGISWQTQYINDSENVFVGNKALSTVNWYLSGGSILNAKMLHTTNGGAPIGIEPISSEVPDKFVLYQNYPNPFNPSTKIKFSLPSPSKGGVVYVRLVIYDILGKEVASLIPPLWGGQEGLQPGTYEVEWNASNYPSGIFFYRLTVMDASAPLSIKHLATKKMVLLK